MTYSEMQKQYNDLLEAVLSNRLESAFSIISKLLIHIGSSEIHNRNNSLTDTYRCMLKYSFGLTPDPERENIHLHLKQSILELIDEIRDFWIRSMNLFDRKPITGKVLQFESFYADGAKQLVLMLSDDNGANKDIPDGFSENQSSQQLAGQLFYSFWLKNKFSTNDINLFNQIMEYPEIDWSIKSLMISAVTLSQLRHFDSEKFIILFNLSQAGKPEIRQRAMIGMFLSLFSQLKRISLYPKLVERIKSIPDDRVFQQRMLAILIQFIRATETEKVTRQIQEEIVPEVLKIRSELEDKLNLNELLSKENFEDKNPEWENIFKDAPDVYQKLEQFSKMQIEGSDVFMGAFAMLKHFPFFKEIYNWFVPFRADNGAIKETITIFSEEMDIAGFVDGLEQSTVLCNSDKYSFLLNMHQMPSQQRKMMLELFNMELKAMNEMMEDEFKLDVETKNKIINTQYLQDIYRFFKLHPNRKEYESIFDLRIDLLESDIIRSVFDEASIIRNLAEFYFSRDRYKEALGLFEWIYQKEKTFELLEKMGFCFQKLGDFTRAIEMYQQAELFDKNKLWLQKKLGYCYRKTGKYEKAIAYYKQVIKTESKDLNNLAYLGQLYMDIEDFQEALKYYYKVEYENPKNEKIFRPVGWCSFVLGKYENAIKYFEKVVKEKPGKSDFFNIGHCYWVSGQTENAINAYREALRCSVNDEHWFRESFSKDSKYLKIKGIGNLEIYLMMDYILMGE